MSRRVLPLIPLFEGDPPDDFQGHWKVPTGFQWGPPAPPRPREPPAK